MACSMTVGRLLLTATLFLGIAMPSEGHARHRRASDFTEPAAAAQSSKRDTTYAVTVGADPSQALNAFDPLRALGAGVDAVADGAVPQIYTPPNIKTMLSAGLGPVTYRLYTELSVQDWHWNPVGSWSGAGEGYWTGAVSDSPPVVNSYGYRLPHRGFTHDQGNDDDYSRLDDGDRATYWKSNPYLEASYTAEPHPQWALVDLGSRRAVDAIRIDWANPYARDYRVEYWTGADAINDPAHGQWQTFPKGTITGAHGGSVTFRLASSPTRVRFVRVFMTSSSQTCDTHGSRDARDCVGYAIAELGLGKREGDGTFDDVMVHKPDQRQTVTYASSVDPWHAASDRVRDEEQPGLDIVYRSGLTRGFPAMIPVSMLYGTPENAAAEIRYIEDRGYRVSYVELGEEPDGQYIVPEDYGALYVRWADALHAVDPKLKLGGPVFQGGTSDVQVWPDAHGDVSWLHRFLRYISSHRHLGDLAFMSFEHYPFNPCPAPQQLERELTAEPSLVQNVVKTWFADGLPKGTPLFITEANFSSNTTEVFQAIQGAQLYADLVGSFLSDGGSAIYLYEYEPIPLANYSGCPRGWGAYGMFDATQNYTVKAPTSQYFAAQMVTQAWAQPTDALQTVYPVSTNLPALSGKPLVTAYALARPDGRWALMLVNKDHLSAYKVTVSFIGASGSAHFTTPVTATTLGPAQYVWHPAGPNGYPQPDGPQATAGLRGGAGAVYTLPAASLTVLSGFLSH